MVPLLPQAWLFGLILTDTLDFSPLVCHEAIDSDRFPVSVCLLSLELKPGKGK